MQQFSIGGKFFIGISDRATGNQEQAEAELQAHFQRICDLVFGRTLAMSTPMPEECRKPFETMEIIISEGVFHQHFQVNLPHRRVIARSLPAAEFVLFSSMLLVYPEIVNFLKAQRP